VIAQLSNPDMRVPIAHALGYPERIASGARSLDFAALGSLSFERPDERRFPCLRLAYEALQAGGCAPAVINAANEVAVEAFLAGRLAFTRIPQVIEDALARVAASDAAGLSEVMAADKEARRRAAARVASMAGQAA
jgi:1-deoxy-D-xylulose-5-phosphate reductoisomerase